MFIKDEEIKDTVLHPIISAVNVLSVIRKGILENIFDVYQNANIRHNPHLPTLLHACAIYPGSPHTGLLFHCQTVESAQEIAYNHNGTVLLWGVS